MIKYFCDRCGSEIEGKVTAKIYQRCVSSFPDDIYLCEKCSASFGSWMKSEEREDYINE